MPHRQIRELLRDQQLLVSPPNATVRSAACGMRDRHVAAVIVTEPDGHIDGIFTERDVVDRVVAAGLNPDDIRVGEVMTRNPACIRPDETVRDAMQMMEAYGVRHLPVVENGRAVGVISMRDFVANEVKELEITHEVNEHLAKTIW